jgi:hypothetical protein
MAILNTRKIATGGLGGVTSQNVYKTAFAEINFYEIFGDTTNVRHILLGQIDFEEEVGGVNIVRAAIEIPQEQGGGAAGGTPYSLRRQKWQNEVDERTYNLNNVTRVRTYSIRSQESVPDVTIINAVKVTSISSIGRFGNTEVTQFVNDDEEVMALITSLFC